MRRPNITVMVDWAYNTNLLTYPACAECPDTGSACTDHPEHNDTNVASMRHAIWNTSWYANVSTLWRMLGNHLSVIHVVVDAR